MASLIPGFEYDIFISYRQKDNKHDGWVTRFVENLKGELESTFKEEISVYFDINPHDGLLETHDVDASLKEKLKCLVFIPIISRTYCDPNSFAWEHEFKAFVEQSSKDQFSLKVKLPNGNIANRVLPVRIHDLDIADQKLCEMVLSGVLRGVEFIYAEPGVNRPLTPDDQENKNLYKTIYKNQINKVALAINEIIQGINTEPEWKKFEKRIEEEEIRQKDVFSEKEKNAERKVPGWKIQRKWLLSFLVIAVLAALAIITWPKIFKKNTLEKLRLSGERISVAVMPFQNMTNDTTFNYYSNIIQNALINFLSNYSDQLIVRLPESMNPLIQPDRLTRYASMTPSTASTISQKLDADIFIYGNINKMGNAFRINGQLINSKTKEVYKSFPIEISSVKGMNFHAFDSLAGLVKDYLLLKQMQKEHITGIHHLISTDSPLAYEKYVLGCDAFDISDYATAIKHFEQAISLDSNFIDAIYKISTVYSNQGLYDQAKKWCLKAYVKRNLMSSIQQIQIDYLHARYFDTPFERIKYLRQILNIDNQSTLAYYNLGIIYNNLFQYEKAIPEFEKIFELYDAWGLKVSFINNYTSLGFAYNNTGQYKKEKQLYEEAEQYFPDDPNLIFRQAVLSLSTEKMNAANDYIEKYISIQRANSVSEATITNDLANIYTQGGLLDKAEEYLRKALSLDSGNPSLINNLAYFLINRDRNVEEGLRLTNKALELVPDNYSFLHTKGWGIYKQGKYHEALELLQKSWDLRREKAIYNHEAFLHLEAAKKAVAGQN